MHNFKKGARVTQTYYTILTMKDVYPTSEATMRLKDSNTVMKLSDFTTQFPFKEDTEHDYKKHITAMMKNMKKDMKTDFTKEEECNQDLSKNVTKEVSEGLLNKTFGNGLKCMNATALMMVLYAGRANMELFPFTKDGKSKTVLSVSVSRLIRKCIHDKRVTMLRSKILQNNLNDICVYI